MQAFFSPLAEGDLEAIGDYIADDNPARAVSFVADLRTQCLTIAKTPQAYRPRPDSEPAFARARMATMWSCLPPQKRS